MKIEDLTPPVAVPEPEWKRQLVEFWQQADDIRKIDLQVLLKMGDGAGARSLIESWQQEVLERKKKRAKKKARKKAKAAPVRYAWGGYWTPGYNFGDTELGGGGDGGGGGESVREAVNTGMAQGSAIGDSGAQSTWDGVSPDTQMTVNEDSSSAIEDFVRYCVDQLAIEQTPQLRLRRDPAWSERNHSFGQFDPKRNELNISVAGRHIMDIFRTVAHELVHHRQNEQSELPADAGATGSEYENEANAQAGVLMRNYAQLHPEYFEEVSPVSEAVDSGNKKYSAFQWSDWAGVDPETGFGLPMQSIMSICEAQLAKNKILLESNSQRSVLYFTDLFNLGQTPQVGSTYLITLLMLVDDKILVGNEPTIVKVIEQTGVDEFVVEKSDGSVVKFPYEVVKDRVIYHTFFFNNQAEYNKLKLAIKMKFDTNLSESSGYIPTAKERNDPRFKMALSPDVQPGATGKNANRLGLKTGPQGEPTPLMKNLRNALREFKETGQLPLTEDQDLFEIDMSPSNLRKLVRNIDARAGIEFEMIIPDINTEEEGELEADWDADERIRSIDDAVSFFDDGDYNSSRDIRNLREELDNAYYEWLDDNLEDKWQNEGRDYLRDYIHNNELYDGSEEDLELQTETSWEEQDSNYEQARDEFREEFESMYDDGDWLDSAGYRYATDIERNFDVQWPHYTMVGGGDGEMDIDEVADDFSKAIGRPVNASSRYHGARREPGHYVVEPDGSLEGDDPSDGGLEFVSPPLPLDELLSDMQKIREWAGMRGAYTNRTTGLHMNVSVPDTSTAKLDYVKLALLLGDNYVLEQFGRAANTYAASALNKIRTILQSDPEKANALLEKMRGHMEALATKAVHTGETQKFTSINTKGDYVEFRSPGGDYLDANWDKVVPTLLRTVVALDAAMDPNKYREEYQKKLYKLLDSSKEKLGSPNVNKLLSMYFTDEQEGGSRDIARQLAKELLTKRQAEREAKKGKRDFWWNVTLPQGSRIEVVARTEQEAREKAARHWNLDPGQSPITRARIEPLRPAETVAGQGGERWGIWITGLNKFASINGEQLEFPSRKEASEWYQDRVLTNPGTRSDVEIREIPAEDQVAVQQTQPKGNPTAGNTAEGNLKWYIRNMETGEILHRFYARDYHEAMGELAWWKQQNPELDLKYGRDDDEPAQRRMQPGDIVAPGLGEVPASQTWYVSLIGQPDTEIEIRSAADAVDATQQAQVARPGVFGAGTGNIRAARVPVATTPAAGTGEFTGEWKIVAPDGTEVHRFGGVGNVQADANRVAMAWLQRNPRHMIDGTEVVPVMSE
jgi:hypothetical protein